MTVNMSDIIAVVAVVATLGIAWINHLDRNGDHEHERGVAREQRLQDRRGKTYRKMLTMVYLIADVIAQTLPEIELIPPPPRVDGPSLETERKMAARVASYGSAPVVARFETVATAEREFFLAVRHHHDLHPDRSISPPPPLFNELREARQMVEERRAAFDRAKEDLERASREELAS